jgi:hypothetical protein
MSYAEEGKQKHFAHKLSTRVCSSYICYVVALILELALAALLVTVVF